MSAPAITEPTHRCPGCTEVMWDARTDTDVLCRCGEDAAPIRYCPACDAPDCIIECHRDAA